MFRFNLVARNIHDPLFIRSMKRAANKYRETVRGRDSDALSGEQLLDFTDKGPAYFTGHMAVARRELESKVNTVDFVLEVRDARLPFSTANPDIDLLVKDKPRLIVFNRADISNEVCNAQIQEYYEARGSHVLFTNAQSAWRVTMETVVRFVQTCVPPVKYQTAPHLGVIVGMPNTGKSTLLNALRLAHEYQFTRHNTRKAKSPEQVSRDPGTTRYVKSVPVSLDPPITLLDTPGLTLAGNFSASAGQKLVLLGIIPVSTISMPAHVLARQIYDVLVHSGMTRHMTECFRISRPPVSFEDLVSLLSERSGKSVANQTGSIRQVVAHNIILKEFREGRLGRFTLDKIPSYKATHRIATAKAQQVAAEAAAADAEKGHWKDVEVQSQDVDDLKDAASPMSMKEVLREIRSGQTISRKTGPIRDEKLFYKLREPII
eukprot:PhM_4_TR12691/c0_g1_i1/m.68824